MPISDAVAQKNKNTVLRGSGANTGLIRRSSVSDEDVTGQKSSVIFVDSTMKWLPEAIIEISRPFYFWKVLCKMPGQPFT
ncbi:hypothetical protein HPB48_012215 [Haemaphysalis longicornis]|uniref:Uncharacterized protein n=1 Tax=Haemaphysalis longicornis TaxID=44386 RepID=A0A9J6FWF4_HAELO|nr:hypothetical protein HPB48_012215 [Haemaphysalis longicornis]